ncbi:MAG: membrane lipoprotein lipid attachment site-containing protein [Ruminococcus sp.]|nr:membrane lipoprotein lipid attachment site-containing protein [Ruminococcus sp.]
MKKLILTLAAAAMLTGCGNTKEGRAQEKPEPEAAAVTTVTDTVTTSAKTTSASTTTSVKTTAKTTTAKTTTTAAALTAKAQTTQPQTNSAPSSTSAAAPVKHYTVDGPGGAEEIPEAEWNGLMKVKEKYGKDFEVIARNLCWESWPKSILNDDGTRTTIPVKRDPNEPLDVVYVLKGSDGIHFDARIKEKTDIITHDNYLYTHYWEQLKNEAAGSLQKLVPGGKVFFEAGASYGELPFECPAEMTYEEFRQALADNKGFAFCWLFVAEGMDVSDEMRAYSPRRGDGQPGEYGYILQVHVEQVSKEDYDRLDDVLTEYPREVNSKLIN